MYETKKALSSLSECCAGIFVWLPAYGNKLGCYFMVLSYITSEGRVRPQPSLLPPPSQPCNWAPCRRCLLLRPHPSSCRFFQGLCPNWDVLSILHFHFLFYGCNGVAETSHGSGIREGRRMTAMSDSFMQAVVEGRRVKKKPEVADPVLAATKCWDSLPTLRECSSVVIKAGAAECAHCFSGAPSSGCVGNYTSTINLCGWGITEVLPIPYLQKAFQDGLKVSELHKYKAPLFII